jgi:hypothetical protein
MRQLSPAAFALAIVLFFLPWVAISCEVEGKRQQLCELRGIDLAVGLRSCLDEKGLGGGSELPPGMKMSGGGSSTDAKALIALIAAVVGLAAVFVKADGTRSIVTIVCGFLGAVLVLLLRQGGGEMPGLMLEYRIGYWLALGAFLAAGVLGLLAKRKPASG